jgi:hypothetical protein
MLNKIADSYGGVTEKSLTPRTRQRQTAAIRHGLFAKAPSGLKLRFRRVRRLARWVWVALPWLEPSDEPAFSRAELGLTTSQAMGIRAPRCARTAQQMRHGTALLIRRSVKVEESLADAPFVCGFGAAIKLDNRVTTRPSFEEPLDLLLQVTEVFHGLTQVFLRFLNSEILFPEAVSFRLAAPIVLLHGRRRVRTVQIGCP